MLDDYDSSYHDLLIQCEVSGIKTLNLRLLAIDGFKCVNKLNPEYLNEMFTIKIVHTTFVILLFHVFWKAQIEYYKVRSKNMEPATKTTVNQLYHWVILRI